MRTRIPLPDPNNDPFKDAFDYFEQIQNRKMKQPLVDAQTKEALANASKAQMLSNLINMAFGGSPGGINGAGQEEAPTSIGSNRGTGGSNNAYQYDANGNNAKGSPEDIARAAQGGNAEAGTGSEEMSNGSSNAGMMPKKNRNQQGALDMLQALGVLKETPGQQEAREKRTAYSKDLAASDIKSLEDWNKTITTNSQIMPVLENIQDIAANPGFQEMYKNPEYFGYNLKYLKRFGTPEQSSLLTSLATNTKAIYQSMGQEFKGAFREFELNLFNKATPDEENDTLQQIIAKNNTLLGLRTLVTRRLKLANNIVRGAEGGISPSSALDIADKQIRTKEVFKEINDNFNKMQAEQKHIKEQKDNSNDKSNLKSASSTITLVDPSGQEHIIDKNNLDAALKKYPDLTIKGNS